MDNRVNILEHGGVSTYNQWYNMRPTEIESLKTKQITKVVAGDGHYFALSLDGDLYGWGNNDRWQVTGNNAEQMIIEPLKLAIGSPVTSVGINYDYNSYCILNNGSIVMWGKGPFTRFAFMRNGDEMGQIKLLKDKRVLEISFGDKHAIVLCTT
jgi:alpha-tubulin suppressor-like RCC1 family protein